MALDITQVLNTWAEYGVFSYLFPFLIIFSIVFAILQKTQLFGNSAQPGQKNINGINAIIAVSVAFLSLLNDYVSTFFATIFPRFGIALAIFLVLLILIGFFYKPDVTGKPASLSWIGWALGIGVVLWAWSEWNNIFGADNWGVTYFLEEYFWGLILLGGIGALIYWIVKKEA
jgi:hypothetical protein